ncbi:apolipoprotein N-acyltransferase [Sphingomicrobium sediminis]|uniref:Apolipoprotein N-acyltransferase n=1 Tax=Sphingomicrobium sediminis TaxID=2950949 RepID=A0A9X2EE14_9SPHN|nr:apolipoprotein N-acyltransferase [Sphingomicrobium sediminis]MCM8556303.1 apolipoprotein N-acyltransferase [Sphingomicrobium sediminis]
MAALSERLGSHRAALWLALMAGFVSATGFAPWSLWPFMLLAMAALTALVANAPSLKRALLLGWMFGLGQFVLGLNWIATAFTFQAKMPAWLGWIAVVLLSIYLAVYPALAAATGWKLGRKKPIALVLLLAGAWGIAEFLRAFIFTGFAWNPVAVSMVDLPLANLSRLVGTYGISAATVALGGAIWLLFKRTYFPAGLIAALLIGMSIGARPPATVPSDTQVRIVQPNIGQADKWKPGFDSEAAARLYNLSIQPRDERPLLILWPEAAVVDPMQDERLRGEGAARFERLRAVRALRPGDTLLSGGLAVQSPDGVRIGGATNSIFALDLDGEIQGRYDKAHLVPYGEYLPMRGILEPIGLSRLAPGAFDFSAGPGPQTLAIPGLDPIGMQICYEIIFSGQVVDRDNRPAFIFNPSNDAWFGAWGPPQHLAQARLRAIEEGLPVMRSTPTGISALIAPNGEIIASIPMGEADIIDAPLPIAGGPTPFANLGNLLAMAFCLLLGLLGIALARRAR